MFKPVNKLLHLLMLFKKVSHVHSLKDHIAEEARLPNSLGILI